jgi:hypothetical protein
MIGAEHAATVVGFMRAHREHVRHLVAPFPGVRQCVSSSCYSTHQDSTPRFYTRCLGEGISTLPRLQHPFTDPRDCVC